MARVICKLPVKLGSDARISTGGAFIPQIQAEYLNIDGEIFENIDVHLHAPEGAIPKDGPSAGLRLLRH